MKKNVIITILFTVVFTICSSAQTIGADNKKLESPHKIWLQNSDGQIRAMSNDTISRDFFNAKWVMIQSSMPLKVTENVTCVFQPPTGNAKVYRFNTRTFSEEVLKYINTLEGGTVITVLGYPKGSGDKAVSLQVVLK
ncbi:MAG: hypothetical protein V4651_01625 [Bacteroidota bacterium]